MPAKAGIQRCCQSRSRYLDTGLRRYDDRNAATRSSRLRRRLRANGIFSSASSDSALDEGPHEGLDAGAEHIEVVAAFQRRDHAMLAVFRGKAPDGLSHPGKIVEAQPHIAQRIEPMRIEAGRDEQGLR